MLDLPAVHTHLQRPLVEDEKIPISKEIFDWLSRPPPSVEFPELDTTAEDLATLFRVSTDEHAVDVERRFTSAVESRPPTDGTEDLFHSTWDDNITRILKLILGNVKPIRNSNRNTSTALKRPDYGLLVNNSCIFRGEENGSDSGDDPAQELVEKLIWTYSPLPYILGLSWIVLSLKAFLCTCYRLLRNWHDGPLCCNHSATFENRTTF